MIDKALLTVRKVHALDSEAIVLQRRLQDEASRDAIREPTEKRNRGVSRLASIEDTKAKLRPQLRSLRREGTGLGLFVVGHRQPELTINY